MAIKGKSVIELYNPNTRIKQRYEDEKQKSIMLIDEEETEEAQTEFRSPDY